MITFTGTGLEPNVGYDIRIGGGPINLAASATGTFSYEYTIPSCGTPGESSVGTTEVVRLCSEWLQTDGDGSAVHSARIAADDNHGSTHNRGDDDHDRNDDDPVAGATTHKGGASRRRPQL